MRKTRAAFFFIPNKSILSRGGRSGGDERLANVARQTRHSVRQSKANLGVVKLLDTSATSLVGRHAIHFHDLNRFATSSVATCHVVEQLGDGASARRVAKLLVPENTRQ